MKKLIKKLSKKISSKLDYIHCNDFTEHSTDKSKHYLFNIGLFVVWVVTDEHDVVSSVVAMDKSDMTQFEGEEYEYITESDWEIHNNDVRILNKPKNIARLQELIKYL